jgi:hypothetical protein
MLQIILVVLTVSVGGERRMTGLEFGDLESCYVAAHRMMEVVMEDFDNLGFASASAACMVRTKANPA